MINTQLKNGLYLSMGKWLSIEVSLIEPFTKGRLSLVPGAPAEHTVTTGEHYQDCQMEHGLDDDDFDCPGGDCNFKSDFGTGYTDQKTVYLYIAQRAANFFQMILAGTVSSLSKKEFIECKNNRNSCSTANDFQNNCCTDCSSNTTGNKCNSNRN